MAEQDIVEKLAAILKENGESVLSGESQLSLSTFCLQCLSLAFDSLLDPTLEASFDVLPNAFSLRPQHNNTNFLYDFAQKTIALKILHHPHLSLISGPVDFSSFRNITSLELKRVPFSLLCGLQRVRHNLETLIISRSSFHLSDVFEYCGADGSQGHVWPNLKRVFLPFNGITVLDSSLRLLPVLEVIDLSHNALTEIPDEFECLTELTKLNASYNRLTCIPALPFAKLNTLLLRNNLIELLQGVQEFRSLENVDLRDNCVCGHKRLTPLRDLSNLQQLMLSGNPLAFHPQHRALTAEKLSSVAIRHVLLDAVPFSNSERACCSSSTPMEPNVVTDSNANGSDVLDASFLDASTFDESDAAIVTPAQRSKVKGRRQKAIRPKVQTAGITADVDTQSLGTSYKSNSEEQRNEQMNVEVMRQQLGSEWLQTLTAQKENAQEKAPCSPPQEEIPAAQEEEKEEAEEEDVIYSSKSDDTSHTTDEDAAFGPESDPLIVRSEGRDDPYIITIAGRFMFEKNIDGTLINKLDLRSLSYFEDRGGDLDGGSCYLEVHLMFDHVKKACRERCFIMENPHDRMLLLQLLQPIIEARRKMMQKLQCLICCLEFSVDVRRFGSERSLLAQCPRCHSTKVIHVDSTDLHCTPPRASSFTTLLAAPLATSSAKSSPWKAEKQEEQISEITVDAFRQRQDSTDSDILVLKPPSAAAPLKSLETSDDYFSTKSISTMYSVQEGSSSCSDGGEDGVMTPVVGSLTHEAISSMVQDVYAQSNSTQLSPHMPPSTCDSDHGISFVAHSYRSDHGGQPEGKAADERNGKMLNGIFVNHEDFTQVDHRLKLFLAMNVLAENEELSHVIRCCCMKKDLASDDQPFECLFVVTSTHQHVLRVTEANGEECGLEDVLSIVSTQSLICVTHVTRGLGNQYFSVDCSQPNDSWVFIVKESIWCQDFLKLYTKRVQETSFNALSRLESIAKVDVKTKENIKHQVFLSQDIGSEFRVDECDPSLKNFHLVRLYSGRSGDSVAACIATCPTHLCIASINFCCSAQTSDSKTQQFQLKDRHKIIDIDSVDMPPWNKTEMTLFFNDEMTHEHFQWRISCETSNERDRLFHSINAVFEIVFGVDLNVNLNLN